MKSRQEPAGLSKLPSAELCEVGSEDIDFVTQDIFHQPTLSENDIADQLRIEPFPEGATHA
jgi:hypothetical protein